MSERKVLTRAEQEQLAGGPEAFSLAEKYGLSCFEMASIFRTLKLNMLDRLGLIDPANSLVLQGLLDNVLNKLTSEERLKIIQVLGNLEFTETLKPIIEKSISDQMMIESGLPKKDLN